MQYIRAIIVAIQNVAYFTLRTEASFFIQSYHNAFECEWNHMVCLLYSASMITPNGQH